MKVLALVILIILVLMFYFRIRYRRKHKEIHTNGRPFHWAQVVDAKEIVNFYKVSDDIYRSRQPSAQGMMELKELGFKSIVNLRHIKKDNDKAKGTGLNLVHISINTWTLSHAELIAGVEAIKKAEKPVLVHCLHGSDRTGAVIAAYRVLEKGWTKEEAINELKFGGYGYHQFYFPHILWLIKSLKV